MAEKKRKTSAQQDNVFPIFVKKTKHEHNSGSTSHEPSEDAKRFTLKEFVRLLDFSSVTQEQEITNRMAQISQALLHDIQLVARKASGKETEFEVLEAEFYLQIEGIHEDPFTHGSEEQKVSGRWYFHRAPRWSEDSHRSLTSKTAYRDGSRKGLDLTFGAPLPNWVKSKYFSSELEAPSNLPSSSQPVRDLLRGGILLRSIRQRGPGGKITSGPSLLVDQILAAGGASSIEELVENQWEGNISAILLDEETRPACLYLKEVDPESRKSPKVYFSPRIGLELSHPGTTGPATLPLHPRIRFLPKLYRFFVYPNLLVANGRPQTFLAILQSHLDSLPSAAEAALLKPSLSSDIARTTGIKEPTAAKYLAEYKAGRKSGAEFLKSVIGPRGKGAASSPLTYLKMMGAISTL